jgi:hypothetical protein
VEVTEHAVHALAKDVPQVVFVHVWQQNATARPDLIEEDIQPRTVTFLVKPAYYLRLIWVLVDGRRPPCPREQDIPNSKPLLLYGAASVAG